MIILKKISPVSSGGGGPHIRNSEKYIYIDFVSFFFFLGAVGKCFLLYFSLLILDPYVWQTIRSCIYMYLLYLVTLTKECQLELEKWS